MIGLEDRQALARDIDVAHAAGARLNAACGIAGIELRTLQRWKAFDGLVRGDGRGQAVRATPGHALSEAERARVLAVANEPRFAAVPPARIVPMLADEGVYLASESTFSRVLKEHGQTAHRGRAKAPQAVRPPTTHIATAARQVWCWDMTYLPAQVLGRWFHLYLILDLYSRKIVGWEVHDSDHCRSCRTPGAPHRAGRGHCRAGHQTGIARRQWLHAQGDDGTGDAQLAGRQALVLPAARQRRQRLCRVAVSHRQVPARVPHQGFADLDQARTWAAGFVHWYNVDHRHSGIRYVSPAQRHAGDDHAILAARHALYRRARERNPARWSGHTRNWSPIGAVTLNPERDSVIRTHLASNDTQPLAA